MGRYRVQEANYGDNFDAVDDDAAIACAEEWLRTGDYWDQGKTIFLRAEVLKLNEDDCYFETLGPVYMELQPKPPACKAEEHEWLSPYSLVGGLKENPGVWGSGGGVLSKEVCRHCGMYQLTDTWATNPCDGTQGHTSIEYLGPDDESLAWLEGQEVIDEQG